MIDQYLNDHSLKEEFVKKLGWTWEKDGKTITIPVYDEKGKLIYCRYRHLEGNNKFSTDKEAHPALYCLHCIAKETDIILCEGEPDCARLWQEGIPATTTTSGVKTFSTKLAEPLKGKNVILCLDSDEAGNSSIERYYEILTEVQVNVTIKQLPERYKDISDYFTAGYSKAEFEGLPTLSIDEWHDLVEPEEYGFETVAEINAQEIPEEEWLVNRIMPTDGFTFIVGAEATGKSFYTLSLAKSIATGEAWLSETAKDDDDHPLFSVKNKQNVLIIDKENTKRRVQSRTRWLGMSNIQNIFYFKYPHFFELADPNEEDGLSKMAKAAARKVRKHNIKAIFIDSFTDVMVGNENAAGDVQGFFDAMRRLFPDTSILVLHHASKPAQGVVRTSAQRARGSTNIMAQVYSAFYVEALPKSRTEFTWEQTKAGDAQKFPKFIVELDVQSIEGSYDKTKVAGINYRGIVPDEEMKTDKAMESIEQAFKARDRLSRQDLLDILQGDGVSKRTALRAVKQLKQDGKLDSVPNEQNKSKRDYIWVGGTSDDFYANSADVYEEEDDE